MTTLPAIKRKSTPASEKALTPKKSAKFMTWREREMSKQQAIREEKAIMTKVETSTYRNSYKHNLCTAMLKDGYHKSFEELFDLIEERKRQREEGGPDSVLWQETSLETQKEKLDNIWNYLTKAESAARTGKWEDVYACRHRLADYFLETGDHWLSDHFFKTALETSRNIRLDGRKREAEAHCNMGLVFERNGNLMAAGSEMEQSYQISLGRAWMTDSTLTYGQTACRHLSRIYTKLAEAAPAVQGSQSLLHRAYEMSKEGGDAAQEARAALRLGRNYELAKNSEAAIQHLSRCLEKAKELDDSQLIGEACESLARSHQTQGNIPRSIEYLELFAETSRDNGHKVALVDACNCLGIIYNTMGQYDRSVSHFDSAYQVSTELGEHVDQSAVQLGISLGNQMLNAFKDNTTIEARYMIERICEWKDERINEFGLPLPTRQLTPPKTPERPPDPTEPFREVEMLSSAQ